MATGYLNAITFLIVWIILLINGNAAEKVPDNKVWTPATATFFYGQPRANITCKFVGEPYGVYWMKGAKASTAETLVSKVRGSISGPRYVDGSVAITEDYSLVFNDIQAADEGNYICRVSNHNGFLIVNNTKVQVLDPEQVSIYTEPSVTGFAKGFVHLQCAFLGDPDRVLWNRLQGEADSKTIETVLRFSSGSYEVLGDRRYTWSHNYGLIINALQVRDEGNFTCEVFKSGDTQIKNSTLLTVIAHAEEPYPRIEQCPPEPKLKSDSNTRTPCVYNVTHDQDIFELECSVKHVKPVVDIVWKEGSVDISTSTVAIERSDGAFDVSSTIRRKLNQSAFDLTCTASGLAVNGSAQRSVIVHRVTEEPVPGAIHGGVVALTIIIILVVLAGIVLMYLRWQNPKIYSDLVGRLPFVRMRPVHDLEEGKRLKSDEEEELDRLREKLKAYKPGKSTNANLPLPEINVGLFGVVGAGKSSFINSLHFALNNEYKNVAIASLAASGGTETRFRETVRLADCIHILDNRGMRDLNVKQIDKDLMPQIKGKRGVDPTKKVKYGKQIHCPVIVCKFSQQGTCSTSDLLKFVGEFAKEVNDYYGHYPIVVVTHENNLDASAEANVTVDGNAKHNANVKNESKENNDGNAKNGANEKKGAEKNDGNDDNGEDDSNSKTDSKGKTDGNREDDADVNIDGNVNNDGNKKNDTNIKNGASKNDNPIRTVDDAKRAIKNWGRVPGNYIWTFENYTEHSNIHDTQKSIKYLQFLLRCLEVAESNVNIRKEREGEQSSHFFVRKLSSFKKSVMNA